MLFLRALWCGKYPRSLSTKYRLCCSHLFSGTMYRSFNKWLFWVIMEAVGRPMFFTVSYTCYAISMFSFPQCSSHINVQTQLFCYFPMLNSLTHYCSLTLFMLMFCNGAENLSTSSHKNLQFSHFLHLRKSRLVHSAWIITGLEVQSASSNVISVELNA